MTTPSVNEFLTTKEVAELFRVSVKTVEYWRWKKTGPQGARVGKHYLYRRSELDKWWEQQQRLSN